MYTCKEDKTDPSSSYSLETSKFQGAMEKCNSLCGIVLNTAQKMKFSTKDFFSKCDQIRSFLRIWSHLLKKSLMKNFIFFAVENAMELWQSTDN